MVCGDAGTVLLSPPMDTMLISLLRSLRMVPEIPTPSARNDILFLRAIQNRGQGDNRTVLLSCAVILEK